MPVTGLPTGTVVYYRGYATNTAGTGYSIEDSFTPSGPPTVTVTPATSITDTTAVLGGDVEIAPIHAADDLVRLGVVEQREHGELGQLEAPLVHDLGFCPAFGQVKLVVESWWKIGLRHEFSLRRPKALYSG